jgi:hypothetical protein
MTDKDTWARGLDNATLGTAVRHLAPLLAGSYRADEALALAREAARRIEADMGNDALTPAERKHIEYFNGYGPVSCFVGTRQDNGDIEVLAVGSGDNDGFVWSLLINGDECTTSEATLGPFNPEATSIRYADMSRRPGGIVYVKDGYPNITIEPEGTVTQGSSRFAQFGTVANACAYYEALGWTLLTTKD